MKQQVAQLRAENTDMLGMGGIPSGGGMPHGQHPAMAHMSQMQHHVAGSHPSAFHYQFPGSMTPELTR
ncbi:unnamed protein product [Closterium sp. Naga37s-1]|nr:unnamed protein product [Closterium sp. Naga37s-1]